MPPLALAAMSHGTFPEPVKPLGNESESVETDCTVAERPLAVLKRFEGRGPGCFWCNYCQFLLRDEGHVSDHILGRKHRRSKRYSSSAYPHEGIEFVPDPTTAGTTPLSAIFG